MFGNLGFGELSIVMVIVLVLFGAKRIPEISGSFGKGIREFKRNLNDVEGSLMDARPRQAFDERFPGREGVSERTSGHDSGGTEPKRLL